MEINNLAGQNLSDSANLRTRLARWVGQNLFYRPELIYIFLLALILRLLCLILSIGQIGIKGIAEAAPDSVLYFKMAKDLLSGTSAYEHGFFTFGPGFAYYLAFNMIFFGQYQLPIIFLQILISSASCILIYRLADVITNSRAVSNVAGVLLALSYTSITLSVVLLSDTLYFFLFLMSLILFLRGLKKGEWKYFFLTGIFVGTAILVRSIGQFWPIMMLIMAVPFVISLGRDNGRGSLSWGKILLRISVASLIAIILMSFWIFRNFKTQGIPTLAFTSAGGGANVAALTLEKIEGRSVDKIRQEWSDEYLKLKKLKKLSQGDSFRLDMAKARETFIRYPWETVKTYFSLVKENLNAISGFHRNLLPKYNSWTIPIEHKIEKWGLNYINFWLSMIGFGLLVIARQYRTAIILAGVYFYYAAMIGFTRWQGSRLFYPGQIAALILIAVVYVKFSHIVERAFKIKERALPKAKAFKDLAKAFCGKLILYDPEKSRYYFLFYALAILIGVIIMFRKFIFSDQMLYGADIVQFGYFFRHFLVDYVKQHGQVPLWNPYIFGGIPFVDAIHGNIFYPVSLPKFFFNPFREYGFELIAHIYFSGIFMYLMAREYALSKTAASLAGVSYMFSGCLVSLVAPGHDGKIFVVSLFPLIFLFCNRGFRYPNLLNFTICGLIIGFMLLAPQPQLGYYALLTLSLFALYKISLVFLSTKKFKYAIKPSLLFAYSIILGISISAIQMYPAVDYSLKYSPRSVSNEGYRFATSMSLHPEEAFALVVPEFSGVDSRANPDLHYWGRNSFKDNSEYAGTITIFLALLCIMVCRKKDVIFLGGVALIVLLYALGDTTPFFKLLYKMLPFSSILRGLNMSMYIFLFAVSLLASIFLQSLIENQDINLGGSRFWFRKFLWWIPGIVLILAIFYSLAGEEMIRLYSRIFYPQLFSDSIWAVTRIKNAVASLPDIISGFWFASISLIAASMLIYLYLTREKKIFLILIMLLMVCNGIRYNQRFISLIDQNKQFGPNSVANYLKENAGCYRAFGFACNDREFNLGINGIQGTLGFHGNEPYWYNEFLNHDGSVKTFFNKRFVNLLGAKYVIYPSNGILPLDTLGPIPLDTAGIFGNYVIFINHNCFPRAYFVDKYEVIPDRKRIYSSILNGDLDARDVACLEEKPDIDLLAASDVKSSAVITHYGIDSINISINTPANQILILTDNYFPAWHAYVDGIEKRIYRAYGSFRAVEIPAGSKELIFKYRSEIYDRGKLISLLACIWVIAIICYYIIDALRRRPEISSN